MSNNIIVCCDGTGNEYCEKKTNVSKLFEMIKNTSSVLCKLINLTKIFESAQEELVIFQNVNLNIISGTIIAISGESGSGKSTLLNLVGGLDTVTAGQILFGETDITQLSEDELTWYRNAKVGFIFLFHYSVLYKKS